MKAFLAAVIALIILAFAFTDLPGDLARRIQDSAEINGFIKKHFAGAIAEKIAGGKSPEETRLELIDKIEGSLGALRQELDKNHTPEAAATKIAATPRGGIKKSPVELANEAEDLLEELKSHNADRGLLRDAADKIISKVLPSSNSCVKEPEE